VTRLIGRSPTIREKFYADPIYQSLCEHFLTLETTHWYGSNPITTKSHPLLSIAITFDIPAGTPAQGLHRDDKNHHARHTKVHTYERNRDVLLGLFVPACETTHANGATRVVPGSHLWGDTVPDFGPDGTTGVIDAEMHMGEALIMLGSLYHGGGSYPSPLHHDSEIKGGSRESRTMYAMFSCNGVSRQEEVPWLSYTIDEVRGYSKVVQERLGWKQSEPNLGWVDLRSPEFLLEKGNGDGNS
jgi:ectoine hydroxylase-related dioxygenase (phytanoyl-CoA dioxygenase family)